MRDSGDAIRCGVMSHVLDMTSPRLPLIPLSHLTGSDPARTYRLMEVVRMRLRERRYSVRTEQAYVFWIRRFVQHHGRRHPKELGEPAGGDYLSHLATLDRVAAATQNQALSALTFLFDALLKPPPERLHWIAAAPRSAHRPLG